MSLLDTFIFVHIFRMKGRSNSMNQNHQKRFLWNLIRPQKRWFLFISICILVLTGSNLVQTKSIQQLLDDTQAGAIRQIRMSLAVFVFLLLFNIAVTYLKGICNARFTSEVTKSIKSALTERILQAPYKRIITCGSGDVLKTINQDTEIVCTFLGGSFTSLLTQFVMMVGAFLYLVCTNPLLGILSFLYTPFGMLITYYLNRKKGQFYPEIAAMSGEALSRYEQILLQIPVIRSFAMERIRTKKLAECFVKNYGMEKQAAKYNAFLQTACSMVSQLPKMIYLFIAVSFVQRGRMTLGAVIAIFEILNFIIAPTVYFPFLLDGVLRARASAIRILSLEEQLSVKKEADESKRWIQEQETEPYLKVEKVTFGYEHGNEILSGFSLDCEKPGIIAVTGKSGAGKSTLLDLVAGLIVPDDGRIAIGGRIFAMSQDTYIFATTVAENLRLVKPEATMEEMVEAAMRAGADTFINALPDGYHTRIGDGFLELSGGQKQRISLARMILSDAGIVLMDEPTSALDQDTEQVILRAIKEEAGKRIILMSAHRESLIDLADRRIEL